jgi:hypothetical protein
MLKISDQTGKYSALVQGDVTDLDPRRTSLAKVIVICMLFAIPRSNYIKNDAAVSAMCTYTHVQPHLFYFVAPSNEPTLQQSNPTRGMQSKYTRTPFYVEKQYTSCSNAISLPSKERPAGPIFSRHLYLMVQSHHIVFRRTSQRVWLSSLPTQTRSIFICPRRVLPRRHCHSRVLDLSTCTRSSQSNPKCKFQKTAPIIT